MFPSVRKKLWLNHTLTLRQLKERVDALVAQLPESQDGRVVLLTRVTPDSKFIELPLQSSMESLSENIEAVIGEHLNKLSVDVTDIELEDVKGDKEAVLREAYGDILYLATGDPDYAEPWRG